MASLYARGDVYLLPPPDVREKNPNLVWKVIKRRNGFKESSRGWYLEFDRAMKELGCESVRYDDAMYVLICNILQDSGECQLRVFTDSRVDSEGNASLIDWQSHTLAIPVSSPTSQVADPLTKGGANEEERM